jgi:phosphate/sulfate permease
VLLGSKLGLPVSTTHILIGSVVGVGIARGIGALNVRMVRIIFLSWIGTVPASAVFSASVYYLLSWMIL